MIPPADGRSYLPDIVPACPRCGERDAVQIIVYGYPHFLPSPEEEHRVILGGCVIPAPLMPAQWACPMCNTYYTDEGRIVTPIGSARRRGRMR
jgi:rubredoxin